jgi:hypothetical protein
MFIDQLESGVSVRARAALFVATGFTCPGNTLLAIGTRPSQRTLWPFLAVVLTGMVANRAITEILEALVVHYLLPVFIAVPWLNLIGRLVFTHREHPS